MPFNVEKVKKLRTQYKRKEMSITIRLRYPKESCLEWEKCPERYT